MPHKAVFFDKSNVRWRIIKNTGIALGVVTGIVGILFMASIVFMTNADLRPEIDQRVVHANQRTPLPQVIEHKKRLQQFMLRHLREELLAETKRNEVAARGPKAVKMPAGIIAAFYTTWQQSGIHSLKAEAGKLTHLMPEWVHLGSDGCTLELYDWDPKVVYRNREVMAIARKHSVAIIPIVNNARERVFEGLRVQRMMAREINEDRFCRSLRDWLVQNNYQGANLDFENMRPQDTAHYPAFLKKLAKVLHKSNLLLSIDVEAGNDALDWSACAASCDFFVVMTYDEHYSGSGKGPIASLGWYSDMLQKALERVPRQKLVVGIGNYAYDWIEGDKRAQAMTFQTALLQARDYRSDAKPTEIVDYDQGACNPTYDYIDDENRPHEVWLLDAVTAANQWRIAQQVGVRGGVLWLMGSEDPSVWSFFDREKYSLAIDTEALKNISFPYDVEFVGEGDILRIKSMPEEGSRKLDVSPQSGIATDEEYVKYPSAFVFERNGFIENTVALTFDDGPYEPYTSQILDELKRLNVKATFFLIGENIERHPDIVERMYAEGHEIGNHSYTHPDMGEVTEARARLEINGTSRALQSLIGHGSLLFRVPYNADAEPTSAAEVQPVVYASKLGYYVVGEMIDPEDWLLSERLPNGSVHVRTAKEIADSVVAQVKADRGNAILLHDGGGDRANTVACVPLIVKALRAQGYRFVLCSALINSTSKAVMPPYNPKDHLLIGADRIVFEINYLLSSFLEVAFISAIVLGTLRVVFVLILALLAYNKEKKRVYPDNYNPKVSVVIAAFNEKAVINRTIHAILESNYSPLDVVVIDDGSVDGTAQEILSEFAGNERVSLISQLNMGKAIALNNGIARAGGEIIVSLDADTIFAKDTISRLVRHFSDEKVAAVAGNVKVGNRINILTYWQAIEYISSQNLDRRAYALINAITVVPGAVGAWRKSVVIAAGGYLRDTLAEDMDLTWRIREMGYRIENDSSARGYTEAPDTVKALFIQRFRWTYGTLQCLWKHRSMLGKLGWFGHVMLPALWLFQIVFQILSPLIDLQMSIAVLSVAHTWLSRGFFQQDWQPLTYALESLWFIGAMYAFFFVIELIGAWVAFTIERERKTLLWWLFWQRFVYRQIMYAVALRAVQTALKGIHTGWGKLERKGTAQKDEPSILPNP